MIMISGWFNLKWPTKFPGIYFAPFLSFWQALFFTWSSRSFFVQTFLTFSSILGSSPPVLLVLKFLLELSPNHFFSSPEYSETCSHKCTQYNQLYPSKPVLATVGQLSCRHNSRQCTILPVIKSCTSPQPELLNTWYHLKQIKDDASE